MVAIYKCDTCFRNNPAEGMFRFTKKLTGFKSCPYCKTDTLKYVQTVRHQQAKSLGARDGDDSAFFEKLLHRRTRRPATSAASRFRASSPDDEMEDPKDTEYVDSVRFTPNMRLTPSEWGNATCRSLQEASKDIVTVLELKSKEHTITSKAGRGNTNFTMARKFAGHPRMGKNLSAYRWANWGKTSSFRGRKFNVDRKKSLEWCHLIGDALGGPTVADNLVAASYGANTYMMAIESVLQSQSGVRIQVTAQCSSDHVAELIHYRILSGSKEMVLVIDACNNNFSKADYDEIRGKVKKFIGS